jgi:hypothetical protein
MQISEIIDQIRENSSNSEIQARNPAVTVTETRLHLQSQKHN